MLQVDIENQPVAGVLAQVAKREGTSTSVVAGRFLLAGIRAERERILRERAAKQGVDVNAIVVPDFCSEAFLRQIWGDNWEVGWWLATCALPEPT